MNGGELRGIGQKSVTSMSQIQLFETAFQEDNFQVAKIVLEINVTLANASGGALPFAPESGWAELSRIQWKWRDGETLVENMSLQQLALLGQVNDKNQLGIAPITFPLAGTSVANGATVTLTFFLVVPFALPQLRSPYDTAPSLSEIGQLTFNPAPPDGALTCSAVQISAWASGRTLDYVPICVRSTLRFTDNCGQKYDNLLIDANEALLAALIMAYATGTVTADSPTGIRMTSANRTLVDVTQQTSAIVSTILASKNNASAIRRLAGDWYQPLFGTTGTTVATVENETSYVPVKFVGLYLPSGNTQSLLDLPRGKIQIQYNTLTNQNPSQFCFVQNILLGHGKQSWLRRFPQLLNNADKFKFVRSELDGGGAPQAVDATFVPYRYVNNDFVGSSRL